MRMSLRSNARDAFVKAAFPEAEWASFYSPNVQEESPQMNEIKR